jgi:hypothetical protein
LTEAVEPDAEFKDEAESVERLIVESLSINTGFSGGPVLTNGEEARLLGVLVGGVTDRVVAPGRFAVACPAHRIRKLIEKAVKDVPRGPRLTGGRLVPWPSETEWGDKEMKPQYKKNFVTAENVVFRVDKSRQIVDQDYFDKYFKKLLSGGSSNHFVFVDCSFDGVDFGESYLAFATFDDCDFTCGAPKPGHERVAEPFEKALVTGASFRNCGFEQVPTLFGVGGNSMRIIGRRQISPIAFDKAKYNDATKDFLKDEKPPPVPAGDSLPSAKSSATAPEKQVEGGSGGNTTSNRSEIIKKWIAFLNTPRSARDIEEELHDDGARIRRLLVNGEAELASIREKAERTVLSKAESKELIKVLKSANYGLYTLSMESLLENERRVYDLLKAYAQEILLMVISSTDQETPEKKSDKTPGPGGSLETTQEVPANVSLGPTPAPCPPRYGLFRRRLCR